MPTILSRKATCRSCNRTHEIYGAPGQTVTAEFTCECGQQIRLTTAFLKD